MQKINRFKAKNNIILAMMLTITISLSYSQPVPPPLKGKIRGTLLDKNTKTPIEYASIALYKSSDSSLVGGNITDSRGSFIIDNVDFASYYLLAISVGYQKKRISAIEINQEHLLYKNDSILVSPSITSLKDVSITAERDVVDYKIDKKVINVAQNINAAGKTAIDVLQNTPSVQVDMNGEVSLRGNANFSLLIDGKPSPISPSDMLKQIPAASIENIEIITNPSAKYDAEGTAGIINIIMKKNKDKGLNGIVNVTAGSRDKYSGNILLNYKAGSSNFYTGIDYMDNTNHPTSTLYREAYLNGDTSFLDNTADRLMKRGNKVFRLGGDIYINTKNSLSLNGSIGNNNWDRGFDSRNHDWNTANSVQNYTVSNDNFLMDANYLTSSGTYNHKFKKEGHEFSLEGFYSEGRGDLDQHTDTYLADASWLVVNPALSLNKAETNTHRKEERVKLDYTLPLGKKNKLETGWQSSFINKAMEVIFSSYDNTSQAWLVSNTYSNQLEFLQAVHAGYATFSTSILKNEVQLGIRAEYSDRSMKQITTQNNYPFKKLDYFPSLHISRNLPKEQQIQFSYTRRITRPNEWMLNPYPDYSDAYFLSMGNPMLEPEYIDSYELNYQRRYKKVFYSVEGYFRQTNNTMSRTMVMQPNGIFLMTFMNIKNDYSSGLELTFNYDPYKWWKISLTGNVFQYTITGDIQDEKLNNSIVTWSSQLNNTFAITSNTRIQLNGNYTAPTINPQGKQHEMYQMSASVKQDLFKKKLTLSFNAQNIFKTGKYIMTNHSSNYYSYMDFTPESPVFTLNLSFKINNYKRVNKATDSNGFDFNGGI